MRAWACSCLLLSLTACASEPQVLRVREPVLPPDAYLQPCPISLGNGTIQGALTGLHATIECDRADKAALRAWSERQAGTKKVLPAGG
ncbi:hypothetical protein C7446_2322 [Kushneria sinocarnis]|uniref:Pilus biogenesis CpaD protein n=1 Tax=Kushneria sinocarnis TaxID=595502 RepID=A0A420WVQ0_9GAMM|nr:hypothetical protein [Kushneria sinocarnis]RKR02604.1 hypothetical protein C7446_2322 [Kushneria sinocarnis]